MSPFGWTLAVVTGVYNQPSFAQVPYIYIYTYIYIEELYWDNGKEAGNYHLGFRV